MQIFKFYIMFLGTFNSFRLYMNAHGGIELNRHGGKRKRWQWYFIKGHVHAPPFQPLCFPLNKVISVRLLDQVCCCFGYESRMGMSTLKNTHHAYLF